MPTRCTEAATYRHIQSNSRSSFGRSEGSPDRRGHRSGREPTALPKPSQSSKLPRPECASESSSLWAAGHARLKRRRSGQAIRQNGPPKNPKGTIDPNRLIERGQFPNSAKGQRAKVVMGRQRKTGGWRSTRRPELPLKLLGKLVGARGFEPPTPSLPDRIL